jgi:hypothetical protein
VNRDEVSTVVKDKINEFALRGFRALGVSVADGDQSGPDQCAGPPPCAPQSPPSTVVLEWRRAVSGRERQPCGCGRLIELGALGGCESADIVSTCRARASRPK